MNKVALTAELTENAGIVKKLFYNSVSTVISVVN